MQKYYILNFGIIIIARKLFKFESNLLLSIYLDFLPRFQLLDLLLDFAEFLGKFGEALVDGVVRVDKGGEVLNLELLSNCGVVVVLLNKVQFGLESCALLIQVPVFLFFLEVQSSGCLHFLQSLVYFVLLGFDDTIQLSRDHSRVLIELLELLQFGFGQFLLLPELNGISHKPIHFLLLSVQLNRKFIV